jgi:hypothetical protein
MGTTTIVDPARTQVRHPEWLAGEQLRFVATFLRMEFGAAEFEMLSPLDTLGTRLYHARLSVNSYPQLSFLRVHLAFDSYFDEEFRSYVFASREQRADGTRHRLIRFERDNQNIVVEEWREKGKNIGDKKVKVVEIDHDPEVRDAVATFYLLRSMPMISTAPQSFHILNGQRADSILVNCVPPIDDCSTAAMLPPPSTGQNKTGLQIVCKVPFTGVAGLKKEIISFFSTDGLSLPMSTELQIYIGKVQLTLLERHVDPAIIAASDHEAPEVKMTATQAHD